jgi:uncharacterized protein (UPF0332 family)/predicted nucleotidyltransferase
MATKTNYQSVGDTLKDRLLTELGDRIHSIVLFGSVARGEATDDSDIDVLVITDGRSATEDRIQHVANDFSLANEVLAEVTIFSTETFQTEVRMRSWFASDVLMQGRILTDDGTYGRFCRQFEESDSMETGPTRELVDRTLDMAEESLQASSSDLGQHLFRLAVDRAYYCMHHAAKAILADRGVRPPRSHRGLATIFGRDIGLMSGEFGEMLSDAREHRTDSTYDPFPTVTHEIAENEVRNVERFLDAANALLKPD